MKGMIPRSVTQVCPKFYPVRELVSLTSAPFFIHDSTDHLRGYSSCVDGRRPSLLCYDLRSDRG